MVSTSRNWRRSGTWRMLAMSQADGVPLNELYCPTCGLQFSDYRLHTEQEEFDVSRIDYPILEAPIGRKFLRCPNDHKWTVKVIWRSTNKPDYVQLGEYIGDS